jgi:N-acetyl-gamma-glutamyl-phosphate reductase
MLVSIPLMLDKLPARPTIQTLQETYRRHYDGARNVVCPATPDNGRLDAEALNNSDKMEVFVFGNEGLRQAILIARLDNLGKGASGAAVQNLDLMIQGSA